MAWESKAASDAARLGGAHVASTVAAAVMGPAAGNPPYNTTGALEG
jgi:hypothetical protein